MSIYQEHIYKGRLRIFALTVDDAVAVAVLLHGGGWVAALPLQFKALSQALALRHISSLSIEYSVGAREPSPVYDSLADVQDAVPFVRQYARSLPIIVIGASAGGLVAFHLAMNKELSVAGAVLLNPVLDLSAAGFVSKATPRGGDKGISPLHLPVDAFPPMLIAHGGADTVVPLSASQQLTDQFTARGLSIELHAFPAAGHGFWHLPPSGETVARLIGDFIVKCRQPPALPAGPAREAARPWWRVLMDRFAPRGRNRSGRKAAVAPPSRVVDLEKVRLVIWDLDDTFWSGTLTEGGIQVVPRNVGIVKTLAARGIVSSICSKNDANRAEAELERAGVLDYFVFRRIAWAAKGAMIQSIVKASQLRPETILFIDDNPVNLNEVRHYIPGLQLAEPDILDGLLGDPRFAGKDDRKMTRLAQYKVLEAKEIDRAEFADAQLGFSAPERYPDQFSSRHSRRVRSRS